MCLGFLPHNFSPASIFMGDTGSMLLGLLLAYAPISGITSLDPALLGHSVNRYPEILPLLLPAALLVIPYADLLLAVARRTRAGQSPFAPDRKHLHHRLLEIGHSQRASVLIMYLWAALFSGSIVWLSIQRTVQRGSTNHHGQPVLVFIGITVAAIVALLLLAMPKLRWRTRGAQPDAQDSDLTAVPMSAGIATDAVAELAPTAAMELRPPAAAPEAARGSAEPQLVAAGAVSPMTRLAAPVPANVSPPARVAAAPTEPGWGDLGGAERGWPERDWPDRDWSEPNWPARDQVAPDPTVRPEPGRADPPASAWTLGERSSDHRYAPSHRAPAPADATPVGGNGTRSIIGTPPPAVTGQQPTAMRGGERSLLEPKDAGQVES
jgi:hypothetical protein